MLRKVHIAEMFVINSKGFFLGRVFLSLLIVALMPGCSHVVTDPHDPQFIVAENGKWKITRAQLDQESNIFFKQHHLQRDLIDPTRLSQMETQVLDNLVITNLILEQAPWSWTNFSAEDAATLDQLQKGFKNQQAFEKNFKELGLTIDEVKQRIHNEGIVRHFMIEATKQDSTPTEQDIADFYAKNPGYFHTPYKLRGSSILILFDNQMTPQQKAAKKKAIDRAHARVLGGEDFAAVAREVSQDKYSASKGGDIGFFQYGDNEKAFDDMAFNSKVGTVSPVFETMIGYWFIKVVDSKPSEVIPLTTAHDSIAQFLNRQKKGHQAQSYMEKLRATGNVAYHIPRASSPSGVPSESSPPVHNLGQPPSK